MGGNRLQLAGQRFGLYLVISYAGLNKHRQSMWLCRCDCGTEKVVGSNDLKTGNTTSCGCFQKVMFITHGHCINYSTTPEYKCWAHMMERCYKPGCKVYPYYGGRGISVYEPWHKFEVFLAYLVSTIGLRPTDKGPNGRALYSLDRWPNNDGNYEPDNIRWATKKQQSNNTRPRRRLVTAA